jgi:hypothetical protein
MKHTKLIAIGTFLLLGISVATAQSLGDYAREVRKNKTEPATATRHFDNDNLPSGGDLSVVGPSGSDPKAAPAADAATSLAATKAEKQKAGEELRSKIDAEKDKVASLSRELDLEQREYRLRAAAFYGDAGNRLRDAAQWDKDDAQYKSDIDSRQKAIDAARQKIDDLQEQARKAGMPEKETDSSNGKNDSKDKDSNQDSSNNTTQNKDDNKDK